MEDIEGEDAEKEASEKEEKEPVKKEPEEAPAPAPEKEADEEKKAALLPPEKKPEKTEPEKAKAESAEAKHNLREALKTGETDRIKKAWLEAEKLGVKPEKLDLSFQSLEGLKSLIFAKKIEETKSFLNFLKEKDSVPDLRLLEKEIAARRNELLEQGGAEEAIDLEESAKKLGLILEESSEKRLKDILEKTKEEKTIRLEEEEKRKEKEKRMEELKEKLPKLREAYVRAQENFKKFEGALGSLRGFLSPDTERTLRKELDEAKQSYEQAKAEYISEDLDRALEERTALVDTRAEAAAAREGSFAREIYNSYKKLGERNLEKYFKPTSRLGKFICRFASARTAVSAGLVGIGVWTGAGAAVGLAALGLRRVLAGVGTAGFSYDLMDNYARVAEKTRGKLRELTPDEARFMSSEEITERMTAIELDAQMHGQKASEIETYKLLGQEWKKRVEEKRLQNINLKLDQELAALDKKFEQIVKKSKRDANIRKGIAVSAGALIGSGALYKGIASIKELFWGGAVPAEAPVKPGEMQAVAPETEEAVKITSEGDIITPETPENFAQAHSLLREQGFVSDAVEGKVQVAATIGKEGDFRYLDQALRRLFVQEYDLGEKNVFSALDAAKIENSLANFRELLLGNKIADFNAEDIKAFAQFDGKTLRITDYEAFAKFAKENLFTRADELIDENSNALAYVNNTGRGVWQEMMDQKTLAPQSVEVPNFNTDGLVKLAEGRVFADHISELKLTPTPAIEEVINENSGKIASLFDGKRYVFLIENGAITGIEGRPSFLEPINLTDPMALANLKEATGLEAAAKEAEEALKAPATEAAPVTPAPSTEGALTAIESPEVIDYDEILTTTTDKGGLLNEAGKAVLGEAVFEPEWLKEIKTMVTEEFIERYKTGGFEIRNIADIFTPGKIKAYRDLADALNAITRLDQTKSMGFNILNHLEKLKEITGSV